MKNKVTIIPAKPIIGNNVRKEDNLIKLKIAAYCRVSTEQEEQQGSYEIQVKHYTDFINSNPNWELAGIYADEGISGTSIKNRKDFLRMIEDCKKGKIDKIITKSISRFARNTLDCLNYVRMLRDMNISIQFEKEGINTLEASGELLLTIMASLAQQESESLSKNVKLGYQFRFQQGKVYVNTSQFLGYEYDENRNLVIVPEEAEIVKRIYKDYLLGYGCEAIARRLNNDGVRAKGKKWYTSHIQRILTNEKYMGDALLQKTIKKSISDKRSYRNDGSVPQYYVTDSHEGIISKEIFALVQQEMEKRNNFKVTNKYGINRIYSGLYALSSRCFCSNCGDVYTRTKNGKIYKWICSTRYDLGPKACLNSIIEEDEIKNACINAINTVLGCNDSINEILESNLIEVTSNSFPEIKILDKELNNLQEELVRLVNQKKDYSDVALKISKLREKRENIKKDRVNKKDYQKRIEELKKYISLTNKHIDDYDEDLVRKYIEKIIVHNDYFEFKFYSGIKIEINRI